MSSGRESNNTNFLGIDSPFLGIFANQLNGLLGILQGAVLFIEHYIIVGQPVFKHKSSNSVGS